MIIFKAVILSSGTKCERCGKAEVTCCRSADRNSKRHITCAAESGFQRGGVGAVGRKWLMCVCVCMWMVGGLAEEQAGFYCGPDFFCLFTHCLSGFGEKLLLLCPLRENQTKQNNNNNKKNTSNIQSEDNVPNKHGGSELATRITAPTFNFFLS